MSKWIVGLLLLANLMLFGWMRWGGALTVDADAQLAQASLNADKIQLLELSAASAAAPAANMPAGMPLLLSPVSVPVAASIPASVNAAPVAAAAPSKAANCGEWGEFSNGDLVRAERALAPLKLGDRLTQRNVEHVSGYWVYIPPLKKRADVEKKKAQLKARGVTDYFVVQEEGKWLNAISLGVFRTEEAAQKFLATLRTKDVRSAKVGERMSKLKFSVFEIKNPDAATVGKLEALRKDFPDSEFKVSACSN